MARIDGTDKPEGISGTATEDEIYGEAGNDTIQAGAGDDIIFGGGDDDIIYGEAGSDTLVGSAGNDAMYGGDGNDRFVFDTIEGSDTVNGGATGDTTYAEAPSAGTGKDPNSAEAETVQTDENPKTGGTTRTTTSYDEKTRTETVKVEEFDGSGRLTSTSETTAERTFDGTPTQKATSEEIAAGKNNGDIIDAQNNTSNLNVIFDGDEDGMMSDGKNTVQFSEIEHILAGRGADRIDASKSAADLILDAGEGSDTVTSGSGDDLISLGVNEKGEADRAADILVLNDGFGNDSIEGFEAPTDDGSGDLIANDLLDVSGLRDAGGNPVNVDDVTVSDTIGDGTGDAVLTFPNGESITLWGVDPETVTSDAQLMAIGIPGKEGTLVVHDAIRVSAPYADNDTLTTVDGDLLQVDDTLTFDVASLSGLQVNDKTSIEGTAYSVSRTLEVSVTVTYDNGNATAASKALGMQLRDESGNTLNFILSIDEAGDFANITQIAVEAVGDTDILPTNTINNDDTVTLAAGSAALNYIVEGTSGNDTIDANYADDPEGDMIDANDNLAGNNDDVVMAGDGIDRVNSGLGNDVIYGGSGNDYLNGEDGDDVIYGETGDDFIVGGVGNDTLYGGDDADIIYGNADNDHIFGGNGDDFLYGGDGDDYIYGDTGNDYITLENGNDTVNGGEGNDTIDVLASGYDDGTFIVANGAATGTDNDTLDLSDFNAFRNQVQTADADGNSFSGTVQVRNADNNWVTVNYAEIENLILPALDLTRDFIVEGTANADTIDAGYTGDPEGDRVDNLDHSDNSNNDSIEAYGGNDSVLSGAGNDTVLAGTGSDTVEAGANNDIVYGGDGNDNIAGNGGNDTLLGETDDDTIRGGQGNDSIDGGTGNDLLIGGNDNDTIYGGTGNDTIEGGSDDDTIFGGAGDDVIRFSDDFDLDVIDGGSGGETDGDTIDLSPLSVDTVIDLTDANAKTGSVTENSDFATFTNIENIRLGGGRDTIVLADGSGADAVQAFDMADSGDGTTNDQLDVSALTSDGGTTPVTTNDVTVTDTNGDGSGDAILTFTGGESITLIGITSAQVDSDAELVSIGIPQGPNFIVEGTAGNDTIDAGYTGDPEGDRIDNSDHSDGSNDDSVVAGAGNDIVDAGEGDDTILGGDGNDSLYGGNDNDAIYGGANNDLLSGDAGNDTLYGEAGDDVLFGNANNDSLVGGAGNDVFWDGTGNDFSDGGADADTFYSNYNVGTDTIVGGETGNDNDTIVSFKNADSTLDLTAGGTAADSESGTLVTGVDSLTFSEIETVNLSSGDDLVIGSNGNDSVNTGAGEDTVDGGAGNDRFDLGSDSVRDTVVLSDGDDSDTIVNFDMTDSGDGTTIDQVDVSGLTSDGGTTPVTTANVTVTDTNGDGTGDAILTFPGGESITLVGVTTSQVDTATELEAIGIPVAPDFIVEGTSGADTIDAAYTGDPEGDMIDNLDHSDGSNNDSVEGYAGDDYIRSGAGDDTIDAGDDNDTVLSGSGNDTIYAGLGDDSVLGNEDDDLIYGEDGNDTLEGGIGNDTIEGGDDNDLVYADADDDTVSGGSGSDSVFGGTGADLITGDEGDDVLSGEEGSDTVEGGQGADFIHGGDGDDELDGNENSDTIYGGIGDDQIRLGEDNDIAIAGDGSDTVDGGAGDDMIFGDEPLSVEYNPGAAQGSGAGGAQITNLTDFPTDTFTVEMQYSGAGMSTPGPDDPAITTTLFSYGTATSPSELVVYAVSDNEIYDLSTPLDLTDTIIEIGFVTVEVNGNSYTTSIPSSTVIDGGDHSVAVTFDATAQELVLFFDGSPAETISLLDDTPIESGGTFSLGQGAGPQGGFTGEVFDARLWGDIRTDTEINDFSSGTLEEEAGDPDLISNWVPDPFTGNFRDDVGGNGLTSSGSNVTTQPGFGDDLLSGGDGSDTLLGAGGNDTLDGDGDDTLGGADYLDGGDGNDLIRGDVGDDTLYGRDGADTLEGGAGNDWLGGGAGADDLSGGTGSDTLFGNDVSDADTLIGGDDRDHIFATKNDSVDGGAGGDDYDTLYVGGASAGGSINFVSLGPDSNGNGIDGYIDYFDSVGTFEGRLNFQEIEAFEGIICFTKGANILTETGNRPVENLQTGDLVHTRDNGMQAIRWIGQRSVPGRGTLAPISFAAEALEGATRPLLVSPQHRMLLTGYQAELLFGESEVLVPAKYLVNGKTICEAPCSEVSYYHVMFDSHEVIYADGQATESFYAGGEGLNAVAPEAREEMFAIFPELRWNDGGHGDTARVCLKSHEARVLAKMLKAA